MLEMTLRLLEDRHSEYCGSRCTCPVTEEQVRAWFNEQSSKLDGAVNALREIVRLADNELVTPEADVARGFLKSLEQRNE